MSETLNTDERYSRQRDLVPADRLARCRVSLLGCGAIGRQVALQLTAMGVPWLQLVDFDVVEVGNLAAQGYLEDDLGKLKVDATAELCRRVNSETEIIEVPERFRRSMEVGNVVFCCVDSIETRKLIWEAVGHKVDIFVDGRMSAEVLRILTTCDGPSRSHYPTTLFSANEAYAGSCTSKATIYTASIAAGMMITQLAKHLRHLPVEPDLSLNLLADELTVGAV